MSTVKMPIIDIYGARKYGLDNAHEIHENHGFYDDSGNKDYSIRNTYYSDEHIDKDVLFPANHREVEKEYELVSKSDEKIIPDSKIGMFYRGKLYRDERPLDVIYSNITFFLFIPISYFVCGLIITTYTLTELLTNALFIITPIFAVAQFLIFNLIFVTSYVDKEFLARNTPSILKGENIPGWERARVYYTTQKNLMNYISLKSCKEKVEVNTYSIHHRESLTKARNLIFDAMDDGDKGLKGMACAIYDEAMDTLNTAYSVSGGCTGDNTIKEVDLILNKRISNGIDEYKAMKKMERDIEESIREDTKKMNEAIDLQSAKMVREFFN